MIRVSSGTACVLGLNRQRMLAPCTTAYLMIGERCKSSCAFCAQGCAGSGNDGYLSRVRWPLFNEEEVVGALAGAYQKGLVFKACLQVVSAADLFPSLLRFVETVRRRTSIPLSLSASELDEGMMGALALSGVERIAVPLDAATPALFRAVKKGDWDLRLERLRLAGRIFPAGASTHLIVGLGETEEEMVMLIERLHGEGITVGLFAFTPLPGTAMERVPPPPLSSYRRIQAAHYLVRSDARWPLAFREGRIVFEGDHDALRALLADGSAFRTSGCANCNRPYYNERTRGPCYNYPRPLTVEECRLALDEALQPPE